MISVREQQTENYKNAADFEAALVSKIRNDFNDVSYEQATCYAAALAIYQVQANFTAEQKDTVIDYETLFRLCGATYKAKQKWLRDSLGDNLSKLNDMYFVHPQLAVRDFLNSRGKSFGRLPPAAGGASK